MATRTALFLGVILSLLVASVARAEPVTWTFYRTSCMNGAFGNPGPSCVTTAPTAPTPIATLTLPGPSSTGSADFGGPGSTPVLTGDGNNFTLSFGSPYCPGDPNFCIDGIYINPPNSLAQNYTRFYDVIWTEYDFVLNGISICFDTIDDDYACGFYASDGGFGLNGGTISSTIDPQICKVFNSCQVGGYWASNISEPGSLISMLTLLIMLAGQIWRPLADRNALIAGA